MDLRFFGPPPSGLIGEYYPFNYGRDVLKGRDVASEVKPPPLACCGAGEGVDLVLWVSTLYLLPLSLFAAVATIFLRLQLRTPLCTIIGIQCLIPVLDSIQRMSRLSFQTQIGPGLILASFARIIALFTAGIAYLESLAIRREQTMSASSTKVR